MMHVLKQSEGAWLVSAKALISLTLGMWHADPEKPLCISVVCSLGDGRSSSLQIMNAYILQEMGMDGIKLVQPTYDGLPGWNLQA